MKKTILAALVLAAACPSVGAQDDPAFKVSHPRNQSYSVPKSAGNESPAYRQDARTAVQALQAMHSVVKVGVTYQDYAKRLQDCRIAVDQFLNKYPSNNRLKNPIKKAMATFEDAGAIWDIKFAGTGVTNFVPGSDSTMQAAFQRYPGLQAELDRSGAKTEYGYHVTSVTSALWTRAGKQADVLFRSI